MSLSDIAQSGSSAVVPGNLDLGNAASSLFFPDISGLGGSFGNFATDFSGSAFGDPSMLGGGLDIGSMLGQDFMQTSQMPNVPMGDVGGQLSQQQPVPQTQVPQGAVASGNLNQQSVQPQQQPQQQETQNIPTWFSPGGKAPVGPRWLMPTATMQNLSPNVNMRGTGIGGIMGANIQSPAQAAAGIRQFSAPGLAGLQQQMVPPNPSQADAAAAQQAQLASLQMAQPSPAVVTPPSDTEDTGDTTVPSPSMVPRTGPTGMPNARNMPPFSPAAISQALQQAGLGPLAGPLSMLVGRLLGPLAPLLMGGVPGGLQGALSGLAGQAMGGLTGRATQGPYAGQPISQIPWADPQQRQQYQQTGRFPQPTAEQRLQGLANQPPLPINPVTGQPYNMSRPADRAALGAREIARQNQQNPPSPDAEVVHNRDGTVTANIPGRGRVTVSRTDENGNPMSDSQVLAKYSKQASNEPVQATGGGTVGPYPNSSLQGRVANVMASAGMSPNAIAGVFQNITDESGWNPASVPGRMDQRGYSRNDARAYAHGLYQEGGEEWPMYQKFLNGRDWRDPTLQTQFMIQHFKQRDPRAWQAMNNARSPGEAATIFMQHYLRPQGSNYSPMIGLAGQRAARYERGLPGMQRIFPGSRQAAAARPNPMTSPTPMGPAQTFQGAPQQMAALTQSATGAETSDESTKALMDALKRNWSSSPPPNTTPPPPSLPPFMDTSQLRMLT